MNVEIPIKQLQEKIYKEYNEYKWSKPKLKNGCDNTNNKLRLSYTQAFISKFVTPTLPNGILLWHSVGSGKTLSAIGILKNFEKKGYFTLWVTRTTLRKDLQKALDMIPLKKPLIVLSYKQFSNIGKKRGNLYQQLINRVRKSGNNTTNPLTNTCVIIDEAHKLYTKDLKPQEMHNIKVIQDMIYESYSNSANNKSCKIILMSATPITSDPLEVIHLFNLIIKSPKNRFNVSQFKQQYLDEDGAFTKAGKAVFKDRIKDLVSYIDLSKDPRKFAQVDYNEIRVDISSPIDKENECNQLYKQCIELGENIKQCNKKLKDCKYEATQDKKNNKNEKYQTKILKSRCDLDIKNLVE